MDIDRAVWKGLFTLEKYHGDDLTVAPFEVITAENLLLTAGITALWQKLCGQGAVQVFDATHCYIAVGNGSTPADVSQIDLQGATKTRKLVDSTPVVSTNTLTVVSTFSTTDANHAWEETGIANASTGGLLLNRVVQSFGTKTSAMTWVMTGTLSIIPPA